MKKAVDYLARADKKVANVEARQRKTSIAETMAHSALDSAKSHEHKKEAAALAKRATSEDRKTWNKRVGLYKEQSRAKAAKDND